VGMNQYEHRSLAGLAPAHALRLFGAALSDGLAHPFKKKPNADTALARRLLASALPLKSLTRKGAAKIVRYHLKRNLVAYTSHRKKRIAMAKRL